MNEKHRKQIADLILKNPATSADMIIMSPLHQSASGSMWFEVGEDKPDGDRYKVTVKIEEI